jgi:protein-disulfide isomerase
MESAPVVLIYYTDYVCDSCRAFATQVLPELRARFVDAGALRIVVHDVSTSLESGAIAHAARCAGEFGKYWPFHDSATTKLAVSREAFDRIAADIGVPPDPFERCVAAERHAADVQAKTARARQLGIERLPAFVFVRRGQIPHRPRTFDGIPSIHTFAALIATELRR